MKWTLSALERLRMMEDVFDRAAVERLNGFTRKEASVYLTRWRRAGLVQSAGFRSGIYYNLSRHEEPDGEMRLRALQMAYPTAVLMGESVLHAAGWTTQIPQRMSVAVLNRRSYFEIDGVDVHPRPKRWFRRVHPHLVGPREADFSTYGLDALPPALALADTLADRIGWHPDVDDLDPGEIEENAGAVTEAFELLGAEMPGEIAELVDGVPSPG